MPIKLTSWSFSRYKDYETCPARAKYKHIDKLKEPSAPAMERGMNIHKLAEDYTKGIIKKLPLELKLFKDQFEELRNSHPMVEESWSFTSDWTQTRWDDWANCAVRLKVDAACLDEDTLYVIDHKTGKQREDHLEQLSLYALGGILVHPHVKHIHTQLWYLDSGESQDEKFVSKDLERLKKDWGQKTKAMLNDTTFAPKPGNQCRWCAFSKAKGGPCRF